MDDNLVKSCTRLLEEHDADGINDRLRYMKLTMEQLEQAHYDYLDCIQCNTSEDEDEISKCDAWLKVSLECI